MKRVETLLRKSVDEVHPTWYMVFGGFIWPED